MATGCRSMDSPEKRSSSEESHPHLDDDDDEEGLIEAFGQCKWFNVGKGYGFITPETETPTGERKDVFVYQSKIQMPGFRSLREGEKVRFLYKKSPQGYEAQKVSGPSGENCLGSEKRPKRKKRPDRCYNCCEAGHHAKECQFPPLPKRCHHCKSVEHLVADCPVKREASPGESPDSECRRSPPSGSSKQAHSPTSSSSTSGQ